MTNDIREKWRNNSGLSFQQITNTIWYFLHRANGLSEHVLDTFQSTSSEPPIVSGHQHCLHLVSHQQPPNSNKLQDSTRLHSW